MKNTVAAILFLMIPIAISASDDSELPEVFSIRDTKIHIVFYESIYHRTDIIIDGIGEIKQVRERDNDVKEEYIVEMNPKKIGIYLAPLYVMDYFRMQRDYPNDVIIPIADIDGDSLRMNGCETTSNNIIIYVECVLGKYMKYVTMYRHTPKELYEYVWKLRSEVSELIQKKYPEYGKKSK